VLVDGHRHGGTAQRQVDLLELSVQVEQPVQRVEELDLDGAPVGAVDDTEHPAAGLVALGRRHQAPPR